MRDATRRSHVREPIATDPPDRLWVPAQESLFGQARMDLTTDLWDDFQALRVGSSAKRASAAILGGYPSKRTADKCARLYRLATLVALRIGPETYETAALPLSYVGRRSNIADAFEKQLFVSLTANSETRPNHRYNARIADKCRSRRAHDIRPCSGVTGSRPPR
jgi:hypothetical protein